MHFLLNIPILLTKKCLCDIINNNFIKGEINMGKIELNSIDFSKLHKIDSQYHAESELFHDYKIAYKIFKGLSEYKLKKKQRKIELLADGPSLASTVMPIDEIFDKMSFSGSTMKYIDESISLFDFNKRSRDIHLFFQILMILSKSVQEIHQDPRDIIIGDLNFDNVIIDKNFNPYIIDIDSCQIDGLINETFPAILQLYYHIRGIKIMETTRNNDRLSLILCTLYVIFKKDIDSISVYDFDEKAERIQTLRNMRGFILETKKFQGIPEVPYIHELIAPGDIEIKKSNVKANTRKRIKP